MVFWDGHAQVKTKGGRKSERVLSTDVTYRRKEKCEGSKQCSVELPSQLCIIKRRWGASETVRGCLESKYRISRPRRQELPWAGRRLSSGLVRFRILLVALLEADQKYHHR